MSQSSVPRVITRDITALPIGAIEGFVLSRIDGATTVADIAAVTGLSPEDVGTILAKLADLSAIEVPGYTPKVVASTPPRPVNTPPATGPVPVRTPLPSLPLMEIDVSNIDDNHPDLHETTDVELQIRKEIIVLHGELETRDYYALLGLPRSADRKQVKAAYYGLASKFHTDRYFGRNLGTFKLKLEQIFGRLTLAHDTLGNALRREEYDQYLATQEQTLAYERLLEGYDVDAEPAEERPMRDDVVRRVGSDAHFPAQTAPTVTLPSAGNDRQTVTLSQQPAHRSPTSSATMPVVNAAEQERIRREALARRLAGSSRRMPAIAIPSMPPGANQSIRVAAPASTLPPTSMSARPLPRPSTQPASETGPQASSRPVPQSSSPPTGEPRKLSGLMRKPGDDRMQAAKRAHVQRLVDGAREAAVKGDYLAAANSYRLALQQIDDPLLEAAAADASRKARESMVDVYLKQARWEESDKKWGMAALSYLKALSGRPDDADLSERAANALRFEGRDLHRAARLAEAAVAKNPKKALFRTTLGHIYLDAGLFLRARSELENAARLAPNDAHVRELLTRARKAAS